MSTGVISNLTLPLNTIINILKEISSFSSVYTPGIIAAINSFHNSFNIAHSDVVLSHASDTVSGVNIIWTSPLPRVYGVMFYNAGKSPCRIDGFDLLPGSWLSVSSHRTFPLDARFKVDAAGTIVNIYYMGF